MGMFVSQLRSVPVGHYRYYAYVVDSSDSETHSHWLDKFFSVFAVRSGIDAVIVRGPQNLSIQLFEFLNRHAPDDLGRIELLFSATTCLIISEGALQSTTEPIYVLPLMQRGVDEASQSSFTDAVLNMLLEAIRERRIAAFMTSLGVAPIELFPTNGGMLIATLRNANEMLELKPNMGGIGLNLNAVIEKLLGPDQRNLP